MSGHRAVRGLLLGTLVLAACAACARATRPPLTAAERANVDECHAFAEETAPRVPIHSANNGRSTVTSAPKADSFQTLFDLCMQTKEAMSAR